MPKFSFVIPCYGSEHTIEPVIGEINAVMQQRPEISYEIITVNDGSYDGVLTVLRRLAKTHPELTVIDLAQNMGKHAAIMAGYSVVTGDFIVGLDDDGQCPMDRLWELYEAMTDDYDVVMARYKKKKESLFKRFGSRVNGIMSKTLIGRPADVHFENFSLTRRYVVDEIVRYKNAFPYMEGLVLRTTKRIRNVPMEDRERIAGQGHYTLLRSLRLWLNGFTAFSVKPLQISSLLGLLFALIGAVFGIIVIIRKLCNPDIMMGYSSLMAALMFVSGIIMMMLGLIGEYIGRIYICINNAPQYVIREVIRGEASGEAEEK